MQKRLMKSKRLIILILFLAAIFFIHSFLSSLNNLVKLGSGADSQQLILATSFTSKADWIKYLDYIGDSDRELSLGPIDLLKNSVDRYVQAEFDYHQRVNRLQWAKVLDQSTASIKKENTLFSELLEKCFNGYWRDNNDGEASPYMITKRGVFSEKDPSKLRLIYLNTCYPIEISTSQGGRSIGHCSDFLQYVMYAGARLSTEYPSEIYAEKMKRCPNSVFLHGEYPIKPLFKNAAIRNYWMPNVEQIRKHQDVIGLQTHTFIAKTKVAAKKLNDNFPGSRIIHFSHSTPDHQDSTHSAVRDFNKFFHAYGYSPVKSTDQILECWNRHPEWPNLEVSGCREPESFYPNLESKPNNIHLSKGLVSIDELRDFQRTHGVHICPSTSEGFGHYINDARIVGALVLTTDFAPMNEFIDERSGVLIKTDDPEGFTADYQLVNKTLTRISTDSICESVSAVMKMSISDREKLGNNSRRRYDRDKKIMILKLKYLVWEVMEYFLGRSLTFEEAQKEMEDFHLQQSL